MGWNWVEPDGKTRCLTYAPFADQEDIMANAHGGWLGGYLGTSHTLDMIPQTWYWLGLSGQVQLFVAACVSCLMRKGAPYNKQTEKVGAFQTIGEACFGLNGPPPPHSLWKLTHPCGG